MTEPNMPKPKTTFEVDSSNLQLDFLDACKRQGSNMTKELNKFMQQYVDAWNVEKEGKE